MNGLSLFSSAGIGELYLKQIGIDIKVANELIKRRAELYSKIHKNSEIIHGDITDKKVYKEAISWVEENTNDMKKGDVFSMFIENEKVSLFHNGKFLASSTDPNVAKIIHFPWIGEKPLDEDIKNKLLGK